MAIGRKRWIAAGLLGGLLSGVRFVGLLIALPYLGRLREIFNSKPEKWLNYTLGLFLCPLGLAAYMYFLYLHVGDAFAFKNIQIAWGRKIDNPINVMFNGITSGGWASYFALTALLGLGMSIWLWRRRLYDHSVFLMLSILIPVATHLDSMPRYVFWQMPFMLGIVALIGRSRLLTGPYLAFSSSFGAFMIISWFTGKSFVI